MAERLFFPVLAEDMAYVKDKKYDGLVMDIVLFSI